MRFSFAAAWRACLLAVSLMTAGCAGNGEGLDASGQPLTPGGTAAGTLTADFDSIQTFVFTPICSVCHAGAGAPHGLRLDAANSYNLLVGVPSDEVPAILRVKAGDPDNSYLIQKLEGHAAVGARMPFGGPYLSADTVQFIRQWITEGALRAPPASASAAFTIDALVPGIDDIVSASARPMMIGFSRELDLTRLDAASVRLERVTLIGDQLLATSVPSRLTVPNGRAVLLWPMQALSAGHYRILVRAPTQGGLTDIAGETLRFTGTAAPDDFADIMIGGFEVVAP